MEPSSPPGVRDERPSLDELTALALGADPRRPSLAQLYFGLRGRILRRTYWLHGVGSLLLLGVVLDGLLAIARVDTDTASGLVGLLLLWPLVAVSVKRQHDFNFSAWWTLVHFIPPVGSIVLLLANGIVPGTRGPNRFGADPRETLARPRVSSGH
jgi:uncharacterized membrane protein YhaH (DUF805 family)